MTNVSESFYYFEITNTSSTYDLNFKVLSGFGYYVLSFNPENKFPDDLNHDYMSSKTISSDSLLLDPIYMKSFSDLYKKTIKIVYIGVYTYSNQACKF